jgi:hypothetical protein
MSLALLENLLAEQQSGSLNAIEADSKEQMKIFLKKVDSYLP